MTNVREVRNVIAQLFKVILITCFREMYFPRKFRENFDFLKRVQMSRKNLNELSCLADFHYVFL